MSSVKHGGANGLATATSRATRMGGNAPLPRILLSGPAEQIGTLWGRLNARVVTEDLSGYFIEPAASRGVSRDELVRRSCRFVELAERFAPHWLTEADAVALAAGVDADLYRAYVGTVYRGLWAGEDCTSYTVSSGFTEDHGIFFHKTRDNQPKAQCCMLLDTDAPGVNRFISVSDASVISSMMMVNERGLAGSADTGGMQEDRPRCRGWMNTSLLRHIAERADTCEAALAILEEFVGQGWYAGGGKTGTHWLFVDARGRILEVANNNTTLTHHWHESEKVYFSIQRGTAAERLRGMPTPVDFASFHGMSRDPDCCFPSSVSGMSVHIDPTHPEVFTRAWISMPARSLAFPLIMGGSVTPLPLLNGEADAAGRANTCPATTWGPVEAAALKHLGLLEDRVDHCLEHGESKRATELIDDWVISIATAHLAILSA